MSEKILGFDSEGMQKGKKYVTFRTDKLVPVVSIKWLKEKHNYELYTLKDCIHKDDVNFIKSVLKGIMFDARKKAGVQGK